MAEHKRSAADAFLYHALRFFRVRDSTERAARGFAIGLTFNFFPTFGLGGFLSGFLARIFGGNMVAGFFGGCLLALFWPVLFFLNIRVGSLFIRPPLVIDDMGDVTERTVDALVWGQTFAVGALINSAIAGLLAYVGFLILFERIRPAALRWIVARLRERQRAARGQS